MTRVAFWYDRPTAYTGGLNYIRNLLYAISLVNENDIEPYIFFGTKVDKNIIKEFTAYATVVQTSVLDRNSIIWFIYKVLFRLFGSLFVVNWITKRHKIDVVSHASDLYGSYRPYRLITWIPDFQFLHLPQMFPGLDVAKETGRLRKMICKSDVIVLSSYDALKDFQHIAPNHFKSRATVLQFVSQPSNIPNEKNSALTPELIEEKYKFKGKYFFLPNQFWEHKNHQVVFEAIRVLKERGKELLVVCTGNLINYNTRDTEHADRLQHFIEKNNLLDNIRILGLIDYNDVLFLMRNSVAVINPSRFEGWSSSVEEAKSIGKKTILSRIDVHIEQNPPEGIFFNPDDPLELAEILIQAWDKFDGGLNLSSEQQARDNLYQRTIDYGHGYLKIIREVLSV